MNFFALIDLNDSHFWKLRILELMIVGEGAVLVLCALDLIKFYCVPQKRSSKAAQNPCEHDDSPRGYFRKLSQRFLKLRETSRHLHRVIVLKGCHAALDVVRNVSDALVKLLPFTHVRIKPTTKPNAPKAKHDSELT